MSVFWIHASSSSRFEQEYRDIAEQIGIPGRDDPHVNTMQIVCRWLSDEANGPWLIVLDNVDDDNIFFSLDNSLGEFTQENKGVSRQQPLESFIPRSLNVSVLVTSRSSTAARNLVGDFGDIIKVEPMTDSEALALLETRIPFSESSIGDAKALVQELEGIPLAITHAAAYIRNRERVTISAYLHLFRESKANQAKLLNYNDAKDLRRDYSTRHPTIFTWQITFEQIRKTTPLATDLMALMSIFDRQGIPECLLHDGTDRLQFEDAIAPLLCFSLVRQQAEGGLFEMHRLVQLSTRKWLESNRTLQRWVSLALQIMTEAFPSGEYETWSLCQNLVSHSKEVLTFETEEEDDIMNQAKISAKTGWYLANRSDFASGEMLIRDALKAMERNLGSQHSATLKILGALTIVLRDQGRYIEAENLNRRALEDIEKLLGPEHPSTLRYVENLALILVKQGRYHDAEILSRRAVGSNEKLLGPEHTYTLNSVSIFAITLERQGKYTEAESKFRRVLEVKEKFLGSEHQEVLSKTNDLAIVLESQAKYEESELLYRRALKMNEKVLGLEHPHTLIIMENLANILRKQRTYDEAELLNRKALKQIIKVLGSEHPDTLMSMNNLALILIDQGKLNEAELLNRKILENRQEILGSEHPATLTSLNNLAVVLEKQGRYDEAESLNRLTLEKNKKVLGSEHPDTLISMNNLALMLERRGIYNEAESLRRQTLEKSEKVLGSEHPGTLNSMSDLACIWKLQGKDAEAVELMKKCILLQTRILGVDHPATRDNSHLLSELQTQALQTSALATETEHAIAQSIPVVCQGFREDLQKSAEDSSTGRKTYPESTSPSSTLDDRAFFDYSQSIDRENPASTGF